MPKKGDNVENSSHSRGFAFTKKRKYPEATVMKGFPCALCPASRAMRTEVASKIPGS